LIKVNVDEQGRLASRYGIQGVLVIKFFCEGEEVGDIVGYVPQKGIREKDLK
jgi:thioredoxin 1